jgi:predicted GIY-YIG superfamily endonuclease
MAETAAAGRDQWNDLEMRLPILLDELLGAEAVPASMASAPNLPGVYLFSEGDRPVYIGQSRKLRQRLRNHVRGTSHNQSTFAFARARAEALLDPSFSVGLRRKELEADRRFAEILLRARLGVAAMKFRYVVEEDPNLRTVFEAYASMILGTENVFETH